MFLKIWICLKIWNSYERTLLLLKTKKIQMDVNEDEPYSVHM